MRKLLFTFTLLIGLVGNFNFASAQSVNNSDRRQIERELERQIASDTNETVRVRITTAEAYSINNRETGVRRQASLEGRRNNGSDIWYDIVMNTRRDRIISANWSYGRNLARYGSMGFSSGDSRRSKLICSRPTANQFVTTSGSFPFA